MTTARELLEEVDALMRRNRVVRMEPRDEPPEISQIIRPDDDSLLGPLTESEGEQQATSSSEEAPLRQALATPVPPPNDDIPILTEVADILDTTAPRLETKGDATAAEESDLASEAGTSEMLDDVPLLTDAVAIDDRRYEHAALASPPSALAALAMTTDAMTASAHDAASANDEDAALIGGLSASAFGVVAASLAAHTSARPQPQSRLASDDPRWTALAEDVRFQVLQHLDLFTESGLDQRLQTHIQPIVDRASADLVAAINQHVGQLLREYVAEAIEREIDKWREQKSLP